MRVRFPPPVPKSPLLYFCLLLGVYAMACCPFAGARVRPSDANQFHCLRSFEHGEIGWCSMRFKSLNYFLIVLALLLGRLTLSTDAASAACTIGPQIMQDGERGIFFRVPSVAAGETCTPYAQERICSNGSLSGQSDYRYGSCTVLEHFTGVNLNEHPRQLDGPIPGLVNEALLNKAHVSWYRAMVDVVDYQGKFVSGNLKPRQKLPSKWASFIRASASGDRKSIVSLKWGFKRLGLAPPLPGSRQEAELFEFLDAHILDVLAPHASIIVAGNEPFIDTDRQHWSYDARYGGAPVVVFYERVTRHLHQYLLKKGLRGKVALYSGAFTQLYLTKIQAHPAVRELFAFADSAAFVDGIAVHTHVARLDQIDKALSYARTWTAKPIVVPEYTYIWRMKNAIERGDVLGEAFATRWGYDPWLRSRDYLNCDVFGRGPGCRLDRKISKSEWDDFLSSRPWYINHFLLRADRIFKKHNIHGVAFGFMQSRPTHRQLFGNKPPWYLGYLFSPASLGTDYEGLPFPNYQVLNDFIKLQQN